jgi:hypothetical protein
VKIVKKGTKTIDECILHATPLIVPGKSVLQLRSKKIGKKGKEKKKKYIYEFVCQIIDVSSIA